MILISSSQIYNTKFDFFPKKVKFYKDLIAHIKNLQRSTSDIIVMGDFNVAPTEKDIGIGENNVKRWLRDGKCAFYLKK